MPATIIPFQPRKPKAAAPDDVEFSTRDEMEAWLREELDPEDFMDFLEAYCFPRLRDTLDPEMIEMLDCYLNLD